MDDLLKISRDIDKKNEQMLLDLSLETAEPTEVKGRIHSVECFDSHHGPGVRYVIFLKGCSMRCMYCMDSDTWDPDTDDMQTAEELLDHAERYHSYWRNGGGITVSGGEPLLQIDFLLELFRQAKERGIHTCIDTSLQPFSGEEPFFSKFAVLMQLTDLVIADIKHIDPDEHIKLTGRPFDSIREGFEYLSEIKKKLWIRQVLVPGINVDHIGEIARTVAEAGASIYNIIPLIPQHQLKDCPPPTCEEIEGAIRAAQEYIDVFRHCHRCRADAVGIPGGKDFGDEVYMQRLSAKDTFSHG